VTVGDTLVVRKAKELYERMLTEADAEGVWEGKISAVMHELGVSNRYSEVMGTLRDSGAVEQLRRGAGVWPSIYKVHPNAKIVKATTRHATRLDVRKLEADVTAIKESIGGLNVVKAIADLATEIEMLKRLIKEAK